ncbi:MAG: hypothetical protein IT385_20510 [Deltaproteobacteria bacterium]|nr:hypothetical protein [Deltaproteobacteria bacterium]
MIAALVLALLVSGDTLRTEVVFLQGMQAERAITLWERVIGPIPEATILPGKSPDVVVVKDTPARLARFRALVGALSGGGSADRIYVRPVVHVTPSALAERLAELLAGTRDEAVVLAPDDRSQRLVVKATPARYLAIDKLARALDVPPRGGQRRVIGVEPEPEGGLPP